MTIGIGLVEVPCVPEAGKFGICDTFFLHLYEFFSVYHAGEVYVIDINGVEQNAVEERFLTEREVDYAKYGIYLSTASFVGTEVSCAVMIVRRDVREAGYSFKREFDDCRQGVPAGIFKNVLVESDLSDVDEEVLKDFTAQVAEELPQASIVNPECAAILHNINKYKQAEPLTGGHWKEVDCSSFFDEETSGCFGVGYEASLAAIHRCVGELAEMPADDDTVYILKKLRGNRRVQYVFIYAAAYCTMKCHKHFMVDSEYMPVYLDLLRRFTSKRGNYLNDYVDLLAHPVSAGVYMLDGCAYLAILDTSKMRRSNGAVQDECVPWITVCQAEFNKNKLELADGAVLEERHYGYGRIKMLSMAEAFGLNSSIFERGMDGLAKADKVLRSFEDKLLREGGLSVNTLNCSNTLLFEFAGKTFLGYVPKVSCTFYYKMLPLAPGYKSFDMKFSEWEYNRLYDVCVFIDSDKVVQPLIKNKIVSEKNLHYGLKGHAIGCMLRSIPVQSVVLREGCGFTLEQIGMWSIQSTQCREGKEQVLTQSVTREALRDKHFLTYYGGCVPAVTVEMDLASEAWLV